MNLTGCGRKLLLSNLRYYPGIALEGQRKSMKNLSLHPSENSNQTPLEYKSEGVPLESTSSVRVWLLGNIYTTEMHKEKENE
jgi:hypothetical protein